MNDFPTQPLPEESNESFAERKRKWARENSDRIMKDPYYQGCKCPCHYGLPTYHLVACHPDGYEIQQYNLKPPMEQVETDKQSL